jgi:hypothetical protein
MDIENQFKGYELASSIGSAICDPPGYNHVQNINVIAEETPQRHTYQENAVLSILVEENMNTTRMSAIKLVSVTHKASDYHLHHEWQ